MKHLLILLMAAGLAAAQTETRGASSQTGLLTTTGGIDASGSSVLKVPTGTSDPATCAQGQIFYRTDTNKFRKCTATNTWADAEGSGSAASAGYGIAISGTAVSYDPTDPRQKVLVDEFHAPVGTAASFSVGALHWRYGQNGICTAGLYAASSFGDFGEWEVTSGGTSGHGCWLNHQWNGYGPVLTAPYTNSDKPLDLLWRVKLDSNADVVFYVGLQGLYSGDPPGDTGVFFRFSTTASDTNFMLVSRASSTDTAVSTGVAANTTYNTFRLYTDGTTASKWYASVNGGAALTICASGCNITTNISTGNMQPFVAVFTATTGTKKMTVEKFVIALITSTAAR